MPRFGNFALTVPPPPLLLKHPLEDSERVKSATAAAKGVKATSSRAPITIVDHAEEIKLLALVHIAEDFVGLEGWEAGSKVCVGGGEEDEEEEQGGVGGGGRRGKQEQVGGWEKGWE